MIRAAVITMVCLSCMSCAGLQNEIQSAIKRSALDYTTGDKVATVGVVAAQAADAWQTNKLTHDPEFEEANPVLQKLFGAEINFIEVAAFKVLAIAPVYYFFVYKAKTPEGRAWALKLMNIISFTPVISNSILGGKMLYEF